MRQAILALFVVIVVAGDPVSASQIGRRAERLDVTAFLLDREFVFEGFVAAIGPGPGVTIGVSKTLLGAARVAQ